MRPELKYWRDLEPEEKQVLKSRHNIKVVTYDFICKAYNSYLESK